MRAGVTERQLSEVIVKGENFNLTVGIKNRPKVTFGSVDSCGAGGLIKSRT